MANVRNYSVGTTISNALLTANSPNMTTWAIPNKVWRFDPSSSPAKLPSMTVADAKEPLALVSKDSALDCGLTMNIVLGV